METAKRLVLARRRSFRIYRKVNVPNASASWNLAPKRFILKDTLTGMKTLVGIIREKRESLLKTQMKRQRKSVLFKAISKAYRFKHLAILAMLAMAFAWTQADAIGRKRIEAKSILSNSSMESFYKRVEGSKGRQIKSQAKEFLRKIGTLEGEKAASLLPATLPHEERRGIVQALRSRMDIERAEMNVWLAESETERTYIVECLLAKERPLCLYFNGGELSSVVP